MHADMPADADEWARMKLVRDAARGKVRILAITSPRRSSTTRLSAQTIAQLVSSSGSSMREQLRVPARRVERALIIQVPDTPQRRAAYAAEIDCLPLRAHEKNRRRRWAERVASANRFGHTPRPVVAG
ncbi:MAG TPA: hypothetical protein VEQ59_00670 [Polyangiaceae bacterium]|nr:hypothetical protein [Polyangiaceae bacterium]